MKFARINAALMIAVAVLAGVPLRSQRRDARLAQADKGDGKKDLESLQGTWNIETMGWTGKDLPKELTKGYKFVFAGTKLT